MQVLAVVPARSGSKGVKDKNIYPINGKPLLCYAIKTGLNCESVTDVFISTDSEYYQSIAINAGAKNLGLRSPILSSDTAKTVDVLIDLVQNLEKSNKFYDYIVILQPTSPIRKPEDITKMLNILANTPEATGIVSICRLIEPHPYKLKNINQNGFLESFLPDTSSEIPRQELPPAYKLNGAIYIIKKEFMLDTGKLFDEYTLPYEMEEGVNIDSQQDLDFLEYLVKKGNIDL